MLLLGALPMANVLAVSLLIGKRRPASRPFKGGAYTKEAIVFFLDACQFRHQIDG
jgi:hypothetical protein